MMNDQEKRCLTRVAFQTQIEIFSGEKKIAVAKTENLSIKGVLVKTEDLKTDDPCHIVISLLEGDNSQKLVIEGKVVRVHKAGEAAIFFQEMELETFNHLRSIIVLNDGDPEKIQKELSDYIKSHAD